LKWRHINAALAVMSEWLFTFVTVIMAPSGIANLGWKVYIIFIVFNAVQIPFGKPRAMLLSPTCEKELTVPLVWFLCPETAGKTLEELDTLFVDSDQNSSASSTPPNEKRQYNVTELEYGKTTA
jgi:hypothetical protein